VLFRSTPASRPSCTPTGQSCSTGSATAAERPDPADLDHRRQLLAVLDALDVRSAVLVGHDASGPDAVEFTLDYPDRVARLVLLNTYYGHAPALRFPELIRLLAEHDLTALTDALLDDVNQRLWLVQLTGRLFGDDPGEPDSVGVKSVLPQFFGEDGRPDALVAIRAWTGALFASLDEQDARAARLAALETPVSIIFGARDPYLSPEVARHLASLFPNAEAHLLDSASHWPQWDDPAGTAGLITDAP